MPPFLTRTALRLTPLLLAVPALADQPGAYVFGDSAAEQGNLYTRPDAVLPPDIYYHPDGFFRDSNGPQWTETAYPGIRPIESCAEIGLCGNRLNFAFSGATTGTTSVAIGGEGTGIAAQVSRFEGLVAAGRIVPRKTDTAFIDGGPNTIFEALIAGAGPDEILAAGARGGQELAQSAGRLAETGVGLVLVNDFADAGLAPAFGDDPDGIALANLASQAGSDALHTAIRDANAGSKDGPVIAIVQARKLVSAITAAPQTFGFSNATDACYDDLTGTLCAPDRAGQNRYVFFDNAGHPTENAQVILARYYSATADSFTGVRQAEFAGIAARTLGLGETFGSTMRDQARRPGETGLHPYVFGLGGGLSETDDRSGIEASGPTALIGFGIEQRSDTLTLGATLAFGRGEVDAGKLGGDTDARFAGLYGRWHSGQVFIAADVFGGRGKIDGLTRDIGITDFRPRSSVDYRLSGAEVEAGWDRQHGPWSYSLSGIVRATSFRADPFRETGAEGLNLSVSDFAADRVDAGIGAHVERAFPLPTGLLTIGLDALALRGIGGRTRISSTLDGSEANRIDVSHDTDRDGILLLTPEIGYETPRGLHVSLSYQTGIGGDRSSDRLLIGLRQSF